MPVSLQFLAVTSVKKFFVRFGDEDELALSLALLMKSPTQEVEMLPLKLRV